MAEHKSNSTIRDTVRRILLPLIAGVLSTCVLVFCVLTLLEINKNGESGYHNAPRYLLFVFIFLALTNIVAFFKERTKTNLIRCIILLVFDLALGLIALFGNNNPFLFVLVGGLYCLGIVASRIFVMIQKRTIRSLILNGLVVLVLSVIAVVLISSFRKDGENIGTIILMECVVIAVASFIQVFSMATEQLKLKTLGIIILRTYALEILFGLVAMMVCFALVFMYIEPNITTFGDGMWYCFAVVTTIGFGDFTCVTLIGRALSVVLGLYGLVVVAVITSIFVNFYNETAGRSDKKEIKHIKKQEDEDK